MMLRWKVMFFPPRELTDSSIVQEIEQWSMMALSVLAKPVPS